jgi:hypothetical protein
VRALFGEPAESEEIVSIIEAAAKDVERLGATVVEVEIPNLLEIMANARLGEEFKHYINQYLQATPKAPVRSLTQILEAGLYHAQALATLEDSDKLPQLDEAAFRETFGRRIEQQRAILSAMDRASVDALLYPTSRHAPPLLTELDPPGNPGFASQSFIPALTVPAGYTSGGIPVGLELAARPWHEPTLIRLGYAYEQATKHHHAPSTVPALIDGRSPPPEPPQVKQLLEGVQFEVTATGEQALPPSTAAGFTAHARFGFVAESRALSYEIALSGTGPAGVTGAYLHRRSVRPSGPVTQILHKGSFERASGSVTLSEVDAAALRAGDLYLSVISGVSPLISARGPLVLPA